MVSLVLCVDAAWESACTVCRIFYIRSDMAWINLLGDFLDLVRST